VDAGGPGERALDEVDRVFAALAHPTRRQVLLVLRFRGGEMTAGEIAARFDCSWPTVTRHLKVLLAAGLVAHTRHGRKRIYRLQDQHLRQVTADWLQWFNPSS